MKSKALFSVVFVLSLLVTSFGIATAQDDEIIFGMVLVGPQDDRGWSQAHYEGGLYIEENLDGARMLVFESLNPADTPEVSLRDVVDIFVSEGAQVIFTTSDAFEEDTSALAEDYPDVTFINVSGDDVLLETAPANVGNVMAQIEWSRLIAGCAAALSTETGQIGYLGPLINAETRRVSASAYLGAKYCYEAYNPLAESSPLTFEVTWIGFWFPIPGVTLDATEETNAFFDRGFDVVMSGIDTTEMVTVAQNRAEEGETVYSMPYNSPSGCGVGEDSCLGVPYYNWGPAYLDLVASAVDGTWEQDWNWEAPNWDDINDPATSITGFEIGPGLPDAQLETLESFIDEVIAFATDEANDGFMFLWEGPLALQDGTILAEEGAFVAEQDIWYLPQLLDGMVGASE
ncbi:MAG: BMP family ABC transporter substrate-binding protein [Phototrophicaceae bacterium]